jgi:hypothetical protein
MYQIFTRTWWRENEEWPNGLEPWPGRKRRREVVDTEEEAIAYCVEWNANHDPGRYSLKAEFEEI